MSAARDMVNAIVPARDVYVGDHLTCADVKACMLRLVEQNEWLTINNRRLAEIDRGQAALLSIHGDPT